MRKSTTQGLSGALQAFLEDRGILQKTLEGMVYAIWEEVVGEKIADITETLFCENGHLIVTTTTAPWAHTLAAERHVIQRKLNERLGAIVVESIHFQPKELSGKKRGEPPVRAKDLRFAGGLEVTNEELETIEITHTERTDIESACADIPDSSVQEITVRAMLRERRLERWKEAHGFHRCEDCSVLHNEEGPLCPACAIAQNSL